MKDDSILLFAQKYNKLRDDYRVYRTNAVNGELSQAWDDLLEIITEIYKDVIESGENNDG